uniref:Caspase family p20 domain-containing protein n=1 Tax=Romanomermis culicivorax TaxID=13658 RepID=A0A915K7Y0_ROMCU
MFYLFIIFRFRILLKENESASIESLSKDTSNRVASFLSSKSSPRRNHNTESSKSIIVSTLLAVDKVALIISNSEYQFLPKLSTPACDGQSLAASLLNCDFKTVTLADLTLEEMRSVVSEYCRLLGTGVYG